MRNKIAVLMFLVPVLFSGGTPEPKPPTKPVIEKLEEVNNKMIDLTNYLNEVD